MLRLILIGPQGSGKGTQAEMLVKKFGIPQISTGNILRENIEKGTELGKTAKQIMNEGKLVPDNIVASIIKNRLAEKDCKNGFLLDGYPRNIPQAKVLEGITQIDAVLEVDVPDDECIKRIEGRRTCKCGAVYHVIFNPPQNSGTCDKCGLKLFQRDDDKHDAILKRLATYHKETKVLVDYYKDKCIKINGEQAIDKVFDEILLGLKKRKLIK